MLRFASPVSLTLPRGELLRWNQGQVTLRVVSGTAWVTRPNDLDDHFLHAGESLKLSEGLIGADTDLCLSFEAVRPRLSLLGPLTRVLRLVAGGLPQARRAGLSLL
jgi:Protein of unknown function (DUF2917)